MLQVEVEAGDICSFPCDVLALKYAQGFHGVDRAVATLLSQGANAKPIIHPEPGSHSIIRSLGSVAAEYILFLGVVQLAIFDYSEIRAFSKRALAVVRDQLPNASHLAMTVHGVNYGLDEQESFLAQLGGILDAEKDEISVQRITIVEKDPQRATRLAKILGENWPRQQLSAQWREPLQASITAGVQSRAKPHIFVAMPFAKGMNDTYVLGIQEPINAAGYLCERVDMETFFGDVLERIKSRIETATLVVADLTGSNPNVYLEVGYAWGKGCPTLLLAQEGVELKFDVRGQRCIVYDSIVDLKKKLSVDLLRLGQGEPE
jgi:hypothetical protein